MNILGWRFGGSNTSGPNPEAVAAGIVRNYQQRRVRGELRVDDWLYLELCQVLPEKFAQEVLDRFRRRRSRSDPEAEHLLGIDIGIALRDAQHYAKNFGRRCEGKTEESDRTPPSAANTYRKVIDGSPLTSADEDAVLFGDLLKDE